MPLGIDFTQILLHLFNVVVLFGGLYFLLYAPVKKFMNKRKNYYKKLEESANKKLTEAEEMREKYEENLYKLEEEISNARSEADKSIQKMKKEKEQEARDNAAAIIRDAETKAKEQRRMILESAKDDIKTIVSTATEKIVLGETFDANMDDFLDEVERGITDAQ